MSGKTLTIRQAINHWNLYSLRIFIGREKQRLSGGKTIVNLNEDTGNYGMYIHSDFYNKYKHLDKRPLRLKAKDKFGFRF
ncbi:unnamed protein product [marine sediment metagenome]|uniref:Uncharacterized protein n=1 Tax=marine sediment metagenome TaxID=412755 RepID=X0YIU7_9ZZZZ